MGFYITDVEDRCCRNYSAYMRFREMARELEKFNAEYHPHLAIASAHLNMEAEEYKSKWREGTQYVEEQIKEMVNNASTKEKD